MFIPSTIIEIFLIVFNCKCDEYFDKGAKQVIHRIIYKFYGYSSFANQGPNLGCCGVKFKEICLACQYVVNIEKLY
ncbi:hypothetical protein HZS_8103 [Henneguya salminicola]|nr:hypothetical protein HZS_8103 [Henneguya salminicola]